MSSWVGTGVPPLTRGLMSANKREEFKRSERPIMIVFKAKSRILYLSLWWGKTTETFASMQIESARGWVPFREP
jgi:hypothetical protein